MVTSKDNPTAVMIHNLSIRDAFKVALSPALKHLPRRVVVSEAKIVKPHMNWRLWSRFSDEIYWFGRGLEFKNSVPTPIFFPERYPLEANKRRDEPVFVNANKQSATKGELYSLRRGVLKQNSHIAVFGSGWRDRRLSRIVMFCKEVLRAMANPATLRPSVSALFVRPPNYGGTVSDKLSIMSNHKVAVVIENSLEYVTEKLFDAWFAGCIPVYVGPELTQFGFPAELCVPAAPSVEAVSAAIKKAQELDYDDYSTRLHSFLDSSAPLLRWASDRALLKLFA